MADLPEWQPVERVASPLSEAGDAGRIVVLVASEQAVRDGWAATAAVDLVRSWGRSGQRVMLVDGGLQQPTLHTAAGVSNGEGLTDATLYGASVNRVSQPVDDGLFFLISAGTAVADTQTVVRSSRWRRFSTGVVEAGVTLALYAPDGESGTAAFLGSASDIIVLASPEESAPASVRDLEPLVRAVTGSGPQGCPLDNFPSVAPKEESRGVGRMVMFLLLAAVIAAALGFLISGILGATEIPHVAMTGAPAALQDAARWLVPGRG